MRPGTPGTNYVKCFTNCQGPAVDLFLQHSPGMSKKRLFWIIGLAGFLVLIVVGQALLLLRSDSLKARVIRNLTERLNADVAIEQFHVVIVPRMHLSGGGLVVRVKNAPDLPPFIAIDQFDVDLDLFSVLRGHVSEVEIKGLEIDVPPEQDRGSMLPGGNGGNRNGGPKSGRGSGGKSNDGGTSNSGTSNDAGSKVIIERLRTHDVLVAFVGKTAGKRPLAFRIQDLEMRDLGYARAMPFHASLTNPLPTGDIDTTGTFGPWNSDDFGRTPLSGRYTFSNADLSTIHGISGTLSSTGRYDGRLVDIHASGETDTPDFGLDIGGSPVPLHTSFEATIDGTDGTTILDKVDAKLDQTPILAKGSIVNQEGPGNHDIDLDVSIDGGRIEDVLRLSVDRKPPLMRGEISLQTSLHLPPGHRKVSDRLHLDGHFGLSDAKFSSGKVQSKLQELSRHAQGKDDDEAMQRVASDIRGRFTLDDGTIHFTDLAFRVPGATVTLAGTYGLDQQSLDFHGTLQLEATVSEAVGGFKSFFLKLFDPLFKGKKAGTVLPIKVTGTVKSPEMGLDVGQITGGHPAPPPAEPHTPQVPPNPIVTRPPATITGTRRLPPL